MTSQKSVCGCKIPLNTANWNLIVSQSTSSSKKLYIFLLFSLASLAITSCGGGSSPSTPASPPPAAVSLTNIAPKNLAIEQYEGGAIPSVVISSTITGDVKSLNGKTVYVIAEVPDPLFGTTPQVSVHPSGDPACLVLNGIPVSTPKVYSNNMKISVCHDAACSTHFGNSPFTIPYIVSVLKSFKLNSAPISLTSVSGQLPAPARLPVQLPDGFTNWAAYELNTGPASLTTTQMVKANDGSPNFDVTGIALNPGSYTSTYTVSATGKALLRPPSAPSGCSLADPPQTSGPVFSQNVQVNYTVTADANSLKLSPSSTTVQGTALVDGFGFTGLPLPGGSLSFGDVTYQTWPTAAAGHPTLNSWIVSMGIGSVLNADFSIVSCGFNRLNPNCLPKGDYTATIRYIFTSTGGNIKTDLFHPVKMTVL